jgi:hypothetical protein
MQQEPKNTTPEMVTQPSIISEKTESQQPPATLMQQEPKNTTAELLMPPSIVSERSESQQPVTLMQQEPEKTTAELVMPLSMTPPSIFSERTKSQPPPNPTQQGQESGIPTAELVTPPSIASERTESSLPGHQTHSDHQLELVATNSTSPAGATGTVPQREVTGRLESILAESAMMLLKVQVRGQEVQRQCLRSTAYRMLDAAASGACTTQSC